MVEARAFKNTHLSFSRLDRFERCPLSYRLHYIDKHEPNSGVPLRFRGVESAHVHQGLSETQGHRRIVRPLAGLETERPAAYLVRDLREGAGALELDGRADGVADGQTEQRTQVPVVEPQRLDVDEQRGVLPYSLLGVPRALWHGGYNATPTFRIF